MQREGLEVEDVPVDETVLGEASEVPSPEASPVSEPEIADELREDIDRIDPPLTEYQLANGQWVTFDRMKTRQFFALLRIITRPALPALRFFSLDPARQSQQEFMGQLIGLVLVSIPEAEDETLAFLKVMIRPRDLGVTKEQKAAAMTDFNAYMTNPELDDTVSVIEAIVRREAPDLKALGERLLSMWQLAQKTGQTRVLEDAAKQNLKEQESLEDSLGPST